MYRFSFLVLAASLPLIASATAQLPDKKPFLAGAAASGTTRIALVVSDNIYISREVLDDAKRQVTEVTGLGTNKVEQQASVKIVDTLLEMFAELAEQARPGT